MPIARNSDQGGTLEEFYQEIAAREKQQYNTLEGIIGLGKATLHLLARINELFPTTQLWGLTSLGHLVIQHADDWQTDWFIRITGGLLGEYQFEYLLPPDRRPWPGAYVRGEAPTLVDAERYLLIAMRECRGWENNAELAAHLTRHGLFLG